MNHKELKQLLTMLERFRFWMSQQEYTDAQSGTLAAVIEQVRFEHWRAPK